MKKNVFLSLSLSFFVAFFAISFVSAQTEEPVLTDNNVGETSDNSGDLETVDDILVELEEPEELEGVELENITKVPSGFGMWLRDWREKISIALTFDPVKKAEKQLIYAEERMAIAQKILEESTNANAQKKAEQMIEIAQKHMDNIQRKKDSWIEKTTERAEKLKKNLATHQLRRDKIMEDLADNLPEDAKDRFELLREQMLDRGRSLIGDIDDAEVTSRTFEHLNSVWERIQTHLGAVKEFNKQKKEILNNSELTTEEKVEQIRILQEERKLKLESIRLNYKGFYEDLVSKAQSGDLQAGHRLEVISDAKKILQEKNNLFKERSQKMMELKSEGLTEEQIRERMQQLIDEHTKKIEDLKGKSVELRRAQSEFIEDRQDMRAEIESARIKAERLESDRETELRRYPNTVE